jgi:hypothetical protein
MECPSMIPSVHSREGSCRPILEYAKSLTSLRTKILYITNHIFACYIVLPPMRSASGGSVIVKLRVRLLFCYCYVIDL